jgi:hypothetical protein
MSNTAFWRVVWKEYRHERALWLVFVLLAVLLQVVVFVVSQLTDAPDTVGALFGIAVIVPMFYALGCGASLFAAEHETGTYDWLRSLPVSAGRLAAGKFFLGAASAIMLPPVLCVTAWALAAGRVPTPPEPGLLWAGGVVAFFVLLVLFELFVWAVFFSLILRRVLWATVLAAAAPVVIGVLTVPGLEPITQEMFRRGIDSYSVSLPPRMLAVLVVSVVDLWLSRRWLQEYALPWLRPRESARRTGERHREGVASGAVRGAPFGRLVWQAWRQSRITLTLVLGAAVVVTGPLIIQMLVIRGPHDPFVIPLVFTSVVAASLGSVVFLSDQRGEQFRYFAERGIGPRRVWFSRQVVGFGALFLWLTAMLVCLAAQTQLGSSTYGIKPIWQDANYMTPAAYEVPRTPLVAAFATVGLGLLAYAVGQACSLFIRSGIIAFFVGIISTWAACGWSVLMWKLRVPLWFSVAPLAVVLLWASWLQAPDWMLERTTWRTRGKWLLSGLVPLVAVFVATACYRVYEIPAVRPVISQEERQADVTPEGLETAKMYLAAWSEFDLLEEERAAESVATKPEVSEDVPPQDVEATEEDPQRAAIRRRAVSKFMEAAGRASCTIPTQRMWVAAGLSQTPSDLEEAHQVVMVAVPLAEHVLATCDGLEREGRLDEALQRYRAVLAFARHVSYQADSYRQARADVVEALALQRLPGWAAGPGQTAETIRDALQRLDQEHFSVSPSRRFGVIEEYLWYRDLLALDPQAGGRATAHEVFSIWWQSRFLPWEIARMRRLLDYYTDSELRRIQAIQGSLDSGASIRDLSSARWDRPLATWFGTTPLFERRIDHSAWFDNAVALHETRRRAVRLQLALAAWRAERGQLPRRLDELVGTELDALPTDPFTGQSFLYRPDGFERPVTPRPQEELEHWTGTQVSERLVEFTPFLWSAGPNLLYDRRPSPISRDREPSVADFAYRPSGSRTAHWVTTEEELWTLGWCFPIP